MPAPSSTARGYGYAHRKRRARLLAKAYGTPCPMCDRIMQPGDKLDLDHSVPLALGGTVGDRIVCRSCNRAAGGRLKAALHPSNKPPMPTSRDW